jgi:membrane protein
MLLLGAAAAAAAATLYRYAPSREKARVDVAHAGLAVLRARLDAADAGFGFYVTNFGNYGATYGSLSAVVVLLTWLYLSSYVLLFGAELNSELEHQTAKDTTPGRRAAAREPRRLVGGPCRRRRPQTRSGRRAAGPGLSSTADGPDGSSRSRSYPRQPDTDHPYITSRVTARAAAIAGMRKIGMISSLLSTRGWRCCGAGQGRGGRGTPGDRRGHFAGPREPAATELMLIKPTTDE